MFTFLCFNDRIILMSDAFHMGVVFHHVACVTIPTLLNWTRIAFQHHQSKDIQNILVSGLKYLNILLNTFGY